MMKNKFIKYIIFLLVVQFAFISCEENNNIIGKLALVEFSEDNLEVFVLDQPNFAATVRIALVSQPLEQDVSVSFDISLPDNPQFDLAIEGTHFSIGRSVTIPAGQVFADVQLQAFFDGFDNSDDIRELQLNITSVSNADLFEKKSLVVKLQQYVPLNLDDFEGIFIATEVSDRFGDLPAYSVQVTKNATGNGIIISKLGEAVMAQFGVTVDESTEVILIDEPGNARALIQPSVMTFADACGFNEDILLTANGTGTFESNAVTLSIPYQIVVSCGLIDALPSVILRKN